MLACLHGHEEVAGALIAAGASLEAVGGDHGAPRENADFSSRSGPPLLSRTGKQPSVGTMQPGGLSPLMAAASNGHLGMMQQLLDARADASQATEGSGTTALHEVRKDPSPSCPADLTPA